MIKTLRKTWRENKSFIVFIGLMLVFRSAVADWNDVPTGSMKPTIVEGDRIYVDKLAYDINVPFIGYSIVKLGDPQVNDIIIFNSKAADKRLVKRVIGVPGDIVQMIDNRLFINNIPIEYKQQSKGEHSRVFAEFIQGHQHTVQISTTKSQYANFQAVKVPQDHYLVLGDNRDFSADSRAIGFVPRNEIIGRSNKVVFSLDYDDYFLPRVERFFKAI